MNYKNLFKEENTNIRERYDLSMERIEQIAKEAAIKKPYQDYFTLVAYFIMEMKTLVEDTASSCRDNWTLTQLQDYNRKIYNDILPGNYDKSYANPEYSLQVLGNDYSDVLSALYTEIRGMIVYGYEYRLYDITILNELFIEIYNYFEEEELPDKDHIKDTFYWFMSDYSDVYVNYRVREQLDPELSFAADIINRADLSDMRYLYLFGEYISDNEIKTAKYLNGLSEDKINKIADTFTEGYRMGFVNSHKDLSKKETVNIRYCLGFERIIRKAMSNFEKMGLKSIIYRYAVNSVNKKQQFRIGYYGSIPNKQFDYDHKADDALYFDKAFMERKISILKTSYEQYKELAYVHAGPAVLEVFGEEAFLPVSKDSALSLSEKQQKLAVNYANEAGRIINEYIKGEERSFTIMAFPIPEIGDDFEEIFDEIVKVNTLDSHLYETVQQTIIDALDKGEFVQVVGANANKTNMIVALKELKDPDKETLFENCVADVNIPVGEVFTSPKLNGTCGKLHVSKVYLNELLYKDLELTFEDGMITDYTCKNFSDEKKNKEFIKETVLFHHDTLPLGEFAIGTNTAAYVMADTYKIADKLPILIAEKMGPHFAVGDTCYSHAEEVKAYNPSGKEIIAKDNEISIKRLTDSKAAYFQCHTDITIPYDELLELTVITGDNVHIPIILNGRFVLQGTEILNDPFLTFSVDE